MGFRRLQVLQGAPAGFIGQADIADFTGVDHLAEEAQGFVHVITHRLAVLLSRIEIPVLAKVIGTAVGPVQLVKIDVVGLQAAQAALEAEPNLVRADRNAVLDMVVTGARNLGCENDIVTAPRGGQPGADDFLGTAGGCGIHRARGIELGGVDEIDAVIERKVDLCMTLGFGVLRTPGHRAQADFADLEIAGS